ncbi:CAZyme family GT90 [Paecilomyces variotii]|nr:CAZyme family GT90 [Paecilomyces variotii]
MVITTETVRKVSLGLFVSSAVLLACLYRTTFAFDRPVHSAILACTLTALTLFLCDRYSTRFVQTNSSSRHKYVAIPLTEITDQLPSGPSDLEQVEYTTTFNIAGLRIAKAWILLAALVAIFCFRVEVFRQITIYNECSNAGYASVIPFLVALYDYWRFQRHRSVEEDVAPDRTIYGAAMFQVPRSRLRYVLATAALTLGGFLVASFHEGRNSTYICSLVLNRAPRIHVFRALAVVLDTILLIGAGELARKELRFLGGRRRHTSALWGYGLLAVALFWVTVGIVVYAVAPEHRQYIVSLNGRYLRGAITHAILLATLFASAAHLAPKYGSLSLTTLVAFIVIFISLVSTLWNSTQPFPLISLFPALIASVTVFVGSGLFLQAVAVSENQSESSPKPSTWPRKILAVLAVFVLYLMFSQRNRAMLHPIDLLIFDGRNHHEKFLSQARVSNNLQEAVIEYRHRYKQHPPPGFDRWYHYATSRSSLVIEDFDQIHQDLLPFRALSSQRLRELTHQVATNPFNDVGAIIIRNGTARVQEGIKPTHAWMVEGAAKIIEPFSEYLPDMDLVFNLNDEPRIAVPYDTITRMRDAGRSVEAPPEDQVLNGWSIDRSDGWAPVEPADQTQETPFVDRSWSDDVFDDPVSLVCPSSSKARRDRVWDRRNICLSCIRPHSLGQFVSDWDRAADICHQPDLAYLHGFFLSAASLKVSQELLPVFSQSSVRGFNDILFPSPWNYVDKVKYQPSEDHPDVPYLDKENTLFWIGATSEGVGLGGRWQGMARQRFTHLINNNTLNKVSVMLPAAKQGTYNYKILDGRAPQQKLGLNASVHIAERIVRCGDCDTQAEEFHTVDKVDFQEHWRYRYLFDLDGAAFSGRFLPFLQSNSLPFKTALFRQWFDSRISAWRHFVPQDLRLHDVWSTLAYFAGVRNGEDVVMPPHDREALWIAEEGRKWAAQAIRKEDMEIYFFRLLLEWGRLTDDRRDELGFKL